MSKKCCSHNHEITRDSKSCGRRGRYRLASPRKKVGGAYALQLSSESDRLSARERAVCSESQYQSLVIMWCTGTTQRPSKQLKSTSITKQRSFCVEEVLACANAREKATLLHPTYVMAINRRAACGGSWLNLLRFYSHCRLLQYQVVLSFLTLSPKRVDVRGSGSGM